MELFERIDKIANELAGNKTKLAKIIGIPQNTLIGYFSLEKQEKLLKLLPKILNIYPEISRDWLYFGEGKMLKSETSTGSTYIDDREKELLKKLERADDRIAEKDAKISVLEKEKQALMKQLEEAQSTPTVSGTEIATSTTIKAD